MIASDRRSAACGRRFFTFDIPSPSLEEWYWNCMYWRLAFSARTTAACSNSYIISWQGSLGEGYCVVGDEIGRFNCYVLKRHEMRLSPLAQQDIFAVIDFKVFQVLQIQGQCPQTMSLGVSALARWGIRGVQRVHRLRDSPFSFNVDFVAV